MIRLRVMLIGVTGLIGQRLPYRLHLQPLNLRQLYQVLPKESGMSLHPAN